MSTGSTSPWDAPGNGFAADPDQDGGFPNDHDGHRDLDERDNGREDGRDNGHGDRRDDGPGQDSGRLDATGARGSAFGPPGGRPDRAQGGEEEGSGRIIRSHAHNPVVTAPPRIRRIIGAVVIPLMVLTAAAMIFLWPGGTSPVPAQAGSGQRAYGRIVGITPEPCPDTTPPAGPVCGTATVRVSGGPGSGTMITVPLPNGVGALTVGTGDDIVLVFKPDPLGTGPAYTITDHQRGQPVILLLALCAAVIVAFGRFRGLAAIAGLGVTFGVLLLFVIPAILRGGSPLLVAIVGSAAIVFAVLYLTHGVNVPTSLAVLGTLVGLVLTGALAAVLTAVTRLSGSGEETTYLSFAQGTVDMRGLLLAGIVIGALGVLNDLTVTQAAAVAELSGTATSRMDLYRSAARVGRAHAASAVQTLVLAYAGASLPLLVLLAVDAGDFSDLLTGQFLAQEIVRAGVGLVGLVAAVPVTTALATLVAEIRSTAPVRRHVATRASRAAQR